jgi:hypothetical protein
MAISTYSELQAAVVSFLHRSDLTSIVPDLITIGEKRIFRKVRCRVMETALTGTITGGVVAVPADFLELKFANLVTTPAQVLQKATASQIYAKYPLRASDRRPTHIAREGSNFIFGPYPSSADVLSGIYYAKPTVIATSANALFLANPDLYLFAALCEAAPYIKDDPRIVIWEAKLAQILEDIRNEDAEENASGGGMTVATA